MSQDHVNMSNTTDQNIAQALMEEDLEREIARNEAAVRMAREREEQAVAAKKRAMESQLLMKDMMAKYEQMKNKLEFTKKHLEETNEKIVHQEKITDKIQKMKDRIETYSNKRDAVSCLDEAVQMKKVMYVMNNDQKEDKLDKLLDGETDVRMEKIKANVEENEARLKKREELKEWLETQVAKGEKRAQEQSRIAKAKEDLLELKLKELKLQTQRLERRKEQQKRAEEDNQDFLELIDKQLLEMEERTEQKDAKEKELALLTHQRQRLEKAKTMKEEIEATKEKTRQLQEKKRLIEEQRNKQMKEKEEKMKENESGESTGAIPKKKQNSASPVNTPTEVKEEKKEVVEDVKAEENNEEETVSEKEKVTHENECNDKTIEPEPMKEDKVDTNETNHEVTEKCESVQEEKNIEVSEASTSDDVVEESETGEGEQDEKYEFMDTVKKIEGKCATVKGDLADMAMSEQYLRTKQAMLLAKKKEKEMNVANSIANLREAEVQKMREKVKHMQELLAQRKEKLKIQEEMMKEKTKEKQKMDKIIEARRRRGNYVENEIIDRVVFEKEPPKKK